MVVVLVCKHKRIIIPVTNNIDMLQKTKRFLSRNFGMKDLSDVSFVLGIHIHWDWTRGILELSQRSYVVKVLKRFDKHECKSKDTLVAKGDNFSLNQYQKGNMEI